MGDGDAEVGDGDVVFLGLADLGEEIFSVEHTAAAVEDQPVIPDIRGKAGAGENVNLQGAAYVFFKPAGQLLPGDVAG